MIVAGTDEVGCGALAGDVIAAAVILDKQQPINDLACSKSLTASRRRQLAQQIFDRALSWGIGRASVEEIDRLNIQKASLLAMRRAVGALGVYADLVLADGLHCPDLTQSCRAIVRGDQTESSISAASIVAKVIRDDEMEALDRRYPGYGFGGHKGYPTRAHKQRLMTLGPSKIHRISFAPVRQSANC